MAQILGLVTGILFGVLLQRGGLIRFEKQIGMLLLKDMTVIKFMLSAIAVGMIGIVILTYFGILDPSHREMNVGAVIIGGSLFGIGWAFSGLCPGTSLGALGEGRIHAIFTISGMLVGAMLFSRSYVFLQNSVMGWLNFGGLSFSDILGVSNLLIMPIFVIGFVLVLKFLEKKGV